MEKDELLDDEFLRNLVQKGSLESPSEDFVQRIMEQVKQQPEPVSVKKPFYLFLKSSSGYFALAAFVIFVILSSDISYLNFIPGKKYLSDQLLPYLNSIIEPLKVLFSNTKSLTISLMIIVSLGVLFVIERLLIRKSAVQD